jgi:hypothetical protein
MSFSFPGERLLIVEAVTLIFHLNGVKIILTPLRYGVSKHCPDRTAPRSPGASIVKELKMTNSALARINRAADGSSALFVVLGVGLAVATFVLGA